MKKEIKTDKPRITMNDLPEEMQRDLINLIGKNKDMQKLEKAKAECIKRRDWMNAEMLRKRINDARQEVIDRILSDKESEAVEIKTLIGKMEKQDQDTFILNANAIIMLCDIIESCTMECNSLLEKSEPGTTLVQFDKLIACGQSAKEQMQFMAKHFDMAYQFSFAEEADDVTQLVMNKVKKVMRKADKARAEEKKRKAKQ